MSRTYDFVLPATLGASRVIQAMGTRCKLLASSGEVQIRTDRGAVYNLLPGQGFNLPAGEAFREIYVHNTTGVATYGDVFIGDETFIDDRVTGSVEVVDGERNKVAAGVCYSGVAQLAGASGGPHLQLWNGSTAKNVFVNAIRLGSSIDVSWGVVTCTNPLTTLLAGMTANHDPILGIASSSVMRADNANQVLTNTKTYKFGYVAASTDVVVVLPKPIMLRPETGAIAYLNSTTANMRVTFEFEEWPI